MQLAHLACARVVQLLARRKGAVRITFLSDLVQGHRLSMTLFAFPADRSILPLGKTSTFALTPI
jgi:hypothetical protein